MPTRRSNFLLLSAGQGGMAGVVVAVVVAETVAVAGASMTSTMDEVEATEIGGTMMVAATEWQGAWPVRH